LPKKLSEEVSEYAQKRNSCPRLGKNRVQFLGLLEQIVDALNEGWASLLIWETLHKKGSVSFSYDTFLRYTKELVDPEVLKKSGTIKAIGTQPRKKQSKENHNKLTAEIEPTNKPVKTLSNTFKIDHTLTKEDVI